MGDPAQGLFLVGPTAVGKTAVAHILAERSGLPVLSVDALQVYRGLDIGTAKASRAEREHFRYMGVDLVDPDRSFSVADFLAALRAPMRAAGAAIVAGGSGLYVRCLIQGLRNSGEADPAWRAEAETILASSGIEGLRQRAEALAPGALAGLADPENPRRVIRAVERWRSGEQAPWPDKGPALVGLRMAMETLRERISRRALAMFANGLIEEAAEIRRRWPVIAETAQQAIGYAEAWACLDGTCTQAEALERTVQRSVKLAKKQMTWFRHQHTMEWLDVTDGEDAASVAGKVAAAWERHGRISLHGLA